MASGLNQRRLWVVVGMTHSGMAELSNAGVFEASSEDEAAEAALASGGHWTSRRQDLYIEELDLSQKVAWWYYS